MKYAIVYDSKTGNTKQLADAIRSLLQHDIVYYGPCIDADVVAADIIFIGFWTDKGNCSEVLKQFMKQLHHKQIFLFGTAGFGMEDAYFQKILSSVKLSIPMDCTILGEFMCQGKMPIVVRQRYEKMLQNNPDDVKIKAMITNFDDGLTHPDTYDLQQLEIHVKAIL